MPPVQPLLLMYIIGAALGLWRTDGTIATRVTLALLWPVGVAAAAVTTLILVGAAAVLFPLFGLVLGVGLLGTWWLTGG